MAWFSAVVQDVRSRSNGLRESCLAVLWSLQKNLRWSVGSCRIIFAAWTNLDWIHQGVREQAKALGRGWEGFWIVQLSLAAFPLSPKGWRRHEFQVSAMKSPAFHQHFFRRRLPGIVEASWGCTRKYPEGPTKVWQFGKNMTKSESKRLSMFELSRHFWTTFTFS